MNKIISATAPTVSRALGAYRDENGDKLGKSCVRRGRYGMVEIGGYKVNQHTASVVGVRWVAPDEMTEDEVPSMRDMFLKLYTQVLSAKGYHVEPFGTGLFVRIPRP